MGTTAPFLQQIEYYSFLFLRTGISKALMKEGQGDDNLAIAWEYPGQARVVIPAKFSRLAPKVILPTPMVSL